MPALRWRKEFMEAEMPSVTYEMPKLTPEQEAFAAKRTAFVAAVEEAFAVRFAALLAADPSIPVGRQAPPGVDGVQRFAGPYDSAEERVAPFVVDAALSPVMIDMTASLLFRDFTRWTHSTRVELTEPPRVACADGLKFIWIAYGRLVS